MLTSFLRPGPFPPKDDDDDERYCETVTDEQGNVIHFMRRTPKRPPENKPPEADPQ